MHNVELLLTLTGALAAALVLGYATHWLRLSPIVGYLLAGIALGQKTPGFVANRDLAVQLADLGVILLMFGVGLHFHFKELLAVRRVAVPGAIAQSLAATAQGCALALWAGWGWSAGLVFGLAISVASTVVLLRVLSDNNDLHTPTGHIAVGWLVVEDMITVFVLVLLPDIFRAESTGPLAVVLAIAWSVVKIGLLVAFVTLAGGRLIPALLARMARTHSRELFTLTVLVVALGIAVGASMLFGVSMALGAFLAGMVVGRSEFSSRAASEALPMRDAFAVIFFVSVGMLFDPNYLVQEPKLVAATLGIILLGKPLAALTIVLFLRYPLRVGLAIAVALAQIGEFSFILAALGRKLNILPDSAGNAIVAAAIASISINPLLYRLTDILERRAKSYPRLWRWLDTRLRSQPAGHLAHEIPPDVDPHGRAVVVGYGPVGRTVVRLLQENGIEPTIVELNLDTVHRLREDGFQAVYGDATHAETAREAGMDRAAALILSSSALHNTNEAIRVAREANPDIRVLARASYLREIPALRRAGADAVFTGEGEVALTMTEFLLRGLGASGEQIERQRDRIREELFGDLFALEVLLPPLAKSEATDGTPAGQVSAPGERSAPK